MRRSVGNVIGLILAAALSLTPDSMASQTDDRLGALFARLQSTDSKSEASALTSLIWRIWLQSENDLVNDLMSEGINEMSGRNYTEALAAFTKVVKTDPDFAEGWNKRATVYYLMGEYKASVRDIDRTLTLEPRHFGALSGLGLISLAVGNDRAALRAFEAALKVNPHLPAAQAHVEELRQRLQDRPI